MKTHLLQVKQITIQELRVQVTRLDLTTQLQASGTFSSTLKVCLAEYQSQRPSKTSTFGNTMVRRLSCSMMKTLMDSLHLLEKNSISMSISSLVQKNSSSPRMVVKAPFTSPPMVKWTTVISSDSMISMGLISWRRTSLKKSSLPMVKVRIRSCTSTHLQQDDSISLLLQKTIFPMSPSSPIGKKTLDRSQVQSLHLLLILKTSMLAMMDSKNSSWMLTSMEMAC